MAGIFGFTVHPGDTGQSTVEKLRSLLCHSPYEEESVLASRRACLGVIHPLEAHRVRNPAFDPATGMILALDGEIADPSLIRNRLNRTGPPVPEDLSEAELLLQVFLREGADRFADINGNWSVAVYSEKRDEFTLISDRFATRPIAFVQLPHGFAFFPEVKGVLAFPEFRPKIDPIATAQLFLFRYPIHCRTLLQDVRLIPNASVITYRDSRISTRSYWSFSLLDEYPVPNPEGWIEEYARILKHAVALRVQKPPVPGLTQSGGIDTRLIAASLPEGEETYHTFTFGERGCFDLRFGKRVASAIGAKHHEVVLTPERILPHLERYLWVVDGMVQCQHAQIGALFPVVRNHVDTLLEGAPIGSIFLYLWDLPGFGMLCPSTEEVYHRYFMEKRMQMRPEKARTLLRGDWVSMLPVIKEEFRSSLGNRFPGLPFLRGYRYSIAEHLPRFSNIGVLYLRTIAEVRQPLCDYDLVDFGGTIPGRLSVDPSVAHKILTRLSPRLAKIPMAAEGLSGDPTLWDLFWRWRRNSLKTGLTKLTGGKVKFPRRTVTVNSDAWIRGAYRQRIEQVLSDNRLAERGLLDTAAVKNVLREHMVDGKDRSGLIWPLFSLEMWCRQFFDGEREG